MSRYSEQQRAVIEEAVQGLVGEIEDIVRHQVADGRWRPSYKAVENVTDDELKEAAESLANRLMRVADKVFVATATATQSFDGEN
ncbi:MULTISPECIES: hypothetical protein [Streptomyces]|uniref:hypothetical protein n=1 Tax=Streptomyces TaxID=1883 RepID=UPI00155A0572|nr:hypothetical protein [Streptomyces kasugaensis]